MNGGRDSGSSGRGTVLPPGARPRGRRAGPRAGRSALRDPPRRAPAADRRGPGRAAPALAWRWWSWILVLGLGGSAAAQDDEACLACHDDPELVLERAGAARSLFVDAQRLRDGTHGALDCVLCHSDLAGVVEFPHASRLAPVDCAPCHAADAEAWSEGVHGRRTSCADCHGGHEVLGRGDPGLLESCARCHPEPVGRWRQGVHAGDPGNGHVAAGCGDCHGGHDLRAAGDPRSRVHPLRVPDTCESCHHPDPSPEHPAPGGAKASQYESSVHGQALRRDGLIVTATCASCHGAHDVRRPEAEGAPTSRRELPYTCGRCHAGILYAYLDGVHGAAFQAGGEDVPVCNDCHAEHAVRDPTLAGSSVSRAQVAETCARCHADDDLARRYGFKSSVRRSWGDSYHGIAGAFGERGAANCASCHGNHAILPASDPRSPVNVANLDATCGECHPQATAAFARVPVHSLIDRTETPVAWLVRRVYALLVGALIGAFVLFVLVDLLGRLRLRLRWGPPETQHVDPQAWPDEDQLVAPGETFRRMGRQARLQHGLLIVSFSLLVLTGLPVFLHETPWMRAVVDLEGGFALRSRLHRIAALALIGLSIWHLAALALSRAARRWLRLMLLRPRDLADFVQDLGFSLGLLGWVARSQRLAPLVARFPWLRFDRRPRMGRYGLVEKLEYGAVVWGNLVMIATGLILWRPDWFLDWMPVWTFDVSRVVHGFEATLAFLAIIIWHMYHVHLRPGVFPMSRVWLDGRISRGELRHQHPEEYLEILRSRRIERPAEADRSRREEAFRQ